LSDPLSAWDFHLPEDRIAVRPAPQRDGSRLLVVPRSGEDGVQDARFHQLGQWLRPGDLLVRNNVRVMAARVDAFRSTGGKVEVLFLQPGPGVVEALCKPARRLKVGEALSVPGGGRITIVARPDEEGILRVQSDPSPLELMAQQGELPLPPYLGRREEPEDRERYQTVFAGPVGAAAAPTAGLHFTPELFEQLHAMGVGVADITLDVGLGTFRPLRAEDMEAGVLHTEKVHLPEATVERIAATKAQGGRVIAVGTTSTRALESGAREGTLQPGTFHTNLFIQPGYRFRVVDGLITNFHLPKSSLLMLVAALCGQDRLLDAYAHALQGEYRFYSYGDAMLLL